MQTKLINDQTVADYLISLSNSKLTKNSLNVYPVFDNSVTVSKMCEQLISRISGVYFFHDIRGIHYIGETSNLRSRFISHIKKENNKKLKKAILTAFGDMKFSWVKTSSKMEALILQKKYIRMFKPKCNEIFYKNN
tara:strand:- start:188 stop:595 length:408 start_codon:yes stop_codon:yes gene_type:complete